MSYPKRIHAACGLGAAVTCAAMNLGPLSNVAAATDLEWTNTTPGLLFYDAPTNWNPAQIPTLSDNVLFSANISDPIIIGATSQALDMTFTDNDWELTGAAGGTLNSNGVLTIDDPLATALGNSANVLASNNLAWGNAGNIIVGDTGYGSLTLQDGSDLNGLQIFVGNNVDSTGEITLTGTSTSLTARLLSNTGVFTIGNAGGTGTVNVLNDADLRTTSTSGNDIWVGSGLFDADPVDPLNPVIRSTGTLNVDGVGSFAETEDLNVGIFGGTGFLNITNGGQIINTDGGTNGSPDTGFGVNDGPNGEKASGTGVVDGDGSLLRSRAIYVGGDGAGRLTVSNGGEVRTLTQGTSAGDMYIGNNVGSDGKVAVFGTDTGGTIPSLLDVDNSLYVGNTGVGVLHVGQELDGSANGNGALQVDVDLRIGEVAANQADNKVVVNGAGATANADNVTYVGVSGKGTLEVTGGAQFTGRYLRVGYGATSDGTLLIDGPNSKIDTDADATDVVDNTVIGTSGSGTATVSNGGTLNTDEMWVGYQGNAVGDLLIDGGTVHAGVDNASSGSDLTIGGRTDGTGGTGSVTIQNGGYMSSKVQTVIGGNATGVGSLTVTGVGSLFDNNDNAAGAASNDILRIGQNGAGTAQVLDGGRIEAEGILIGYSSTNPALAADLTVSGDHDGTPSTLDTGGYIYVGYSRPGTMTIDQGAQVSIATNIGTERLILGNNTTSDGSTLTVSDPGSRVDYFGTGAISVGYAGGSVANRVKLQVLNGGVFSAVQRDGSNNIVSQAPIIIGDVDNGNGQLLVDGPGSLAEASAIYVGDGTNNSTGLMDIQNGGTVNIINEMQVGSNGNADGVVRVDGPDSSLTIGDYLSLGDDIPGDGSASGVLNVIDGATVTNNGQAYIGHYTGTVGTSTITSTTANTSNWNVGGELTLAGTETSTSLSGSGTLNVNAGGLVGVASNLRIRNLGVVNLNSGELRVGDNILFTDTGSAFNFNAGTLRYTNAAGYTFTGAQLESVLGTSPTLAAGQHIAVNQAAVLDAPLRLNGGTFSVGGIDVPSVANLDFDTGTFNLTNDNLTVGAGGIFGSAMTVDLGQTVNVTNLTTIDAGSQLTVIGDFSSGGLTNNGDLVIIDTTGAGKTFGGTVHNPAGSTTTLVGEITFGDGVHGAGDFYGPGTAVFAGGYAPGDSAAAVSFDGSVVLDPANTLSIEIGGLTAGAEFDQINVASDITIDGTLDLSLIGGFTPTLGDTFQIINAANRTGSFSSVLGNAIPGGLGFDVLYSPTGVSLQVVAFSLPGDLNGDGYVGLDDLQPILDHWNQNVTVGDASMGDIAGPGGSGPDGYVGLDDLQPVLDHWNEGTLPTPPSSIPEPSVGLLLMGLGTWWTGRRQQVRKNPA